MIMVNAYVSTYDNKRHRIALVKKNQTSQQLLDLVEGEEVTKPSTGGNLNKLLEDRKLLKELLKHGKS